MFTRRKLQNKYRCWDETETETRGNELILWIGFKNYNVCSISKATAHIEDNNVERLRDCKPNRIAQQIRNYPLSRTFILSWSCLYSELWSYGYCAVLIAFQKWYHRLPCSRLLLLLLLFSRSTPNYTRKRWKIKNCFN